MNNLYLSSPQAFDVALSNVSLTPLQQSIVVGRYIPLVNHLKYRTARVSMLFHSSRFIITVGSLIVPALLSIQGSSAVNIEIYWTTWVISLLVTICNAMMSLFKFDKRYFYLHTILEKLISEGWQYIELTGKYSGYNTPGEISTHENQFIYFCHAIEKIRMKQVEEEYYKLSEAQTNNTQIQTTTTDAKTSLIPPTPQQTDLAIIPKGVVESVKGEIAKGYELVSQVIVEDAGGETETETETKKEGVKKDKINGAPESVSVSFNM